MTAAPLDEQAIFEVARKIDSREAREAYLQQICGDDAAIGQRVRALLKAYEQGGSFLEPPAAAPARTIDAPAPAEAAGTLIGPYKLLQQIGEGGMGIVWMAEQTQPVQRKVALKVIKPGMDSRQVIARFEAERQALAIMDHVNIARVFDGGTTGESEPRTQRSGVSGPSEPRTQRSGVSGPSEPLTDVRGSGRPYFVMELVHGVPITKYCDDNHLTPRERLELFVPVCQAIQHAHQKGIIHRDIKPSNVMVTLYDGKPVPKVIDFGVAKATEQKLTERTLFTQYGTMVGTLEYMSPEQAELSALGVDTRSDIYSLGVLLYELLTGSTPLTHKRMKEAAYAEILRMIKEEEPPRPSTRLSDSGEALASISANRHTEPAKLTKLMRGELDWIVMKTLEKDRNRRYETASGFAADVQRYLNDEPVQACPPTLAYRCRKFLRRNTAAVAVAGFVLVALFIGLVGLAVSNQVIAQERDATKLALEEKASALNATKLAQEQAQAQRQLAQAREQEADKQRKLAEHNYRTAREAVDRLFTKVAEQLRGQPHVEKIRRQLLEDALGFYQGFLEQRSQDAELRLETALAHRRAGQIQGLLGEWKRSLENDRASLAILSALSQTKSDNTDYRAHLAQAHYDIADTSFELGRFADSEKHIGVAATLLGELATGRPRSPTHLQALARTWQKRAEIAGRQYKWPESLAFSKRHAEIVEQLRSAFPNHIVDSEVFNRVDTSLAFPRDPDLLKQFESQFRVEVRTWGELVAKHPDVAPYWQQRSRALGRLRNVLFAMNNVTEAERIMQQLLVQDEDVARRFPESYENVVRLAWTRYEYGAHIYGLGRVADGKLHLGAGIDAMTRLRDLYPANARFYSHLVGMLVFCPEPSLRQPERAISLTRLHLELETGHGPLAHLAFAQVHAGQHREALDTCKKAAGTYPIIAVAQAWAEWHVGNKDEARRKLQRVFQALDGGETIDVYTYLPQARQMRREISQIMGIEPKVKDKK